MNEHIADIIYRELSLLPLTDSERGELSAWLEQSPANARVYRSLTNDQEMKDRLQRRFEWQESAETAFARFAAEHMTVGQPEPTSDQFSPALHPTRVHFLKRSWVRYAAAVLIIVGVAAYFMNVRKTDQSELQTKVVKPVTPDFAPGNNKAILTLAGGTTIILDSASDGMLAEQGGIHIIKSSDGRIQYDQLSAQSSSQPMLNTMSTPRGGQYQITLSDGTRVWLNAASSITYPAAFEGKNREVSIVGEAYLEVAKKPGQPFIVQAGAQRIEALGTQFNVNAYADEPSMTTTLLEGKIKVSKTDVFRILSPGDQAVVNDDIKINRDADTDLVMAWKHGLFEFKDQSVESIMRQVARWYNVNVSYEGKINYHFNASISRSVPLSRLFGLLEATGMVHFSINNNTIIVKP